MKILIRHGYVIDPGAGREGLYDVLISEGMVTRVAREIQPEEDNLVIDATGKYVMPGFVDLHVHLREPGYEHKETIKTGAMAAAAGGFTTICAMPNTMPVTDNPDRVKEILEKASREAVINVLPIGAVTKGQEGLELADIEGMVKAGAIAISEDGKSVMDSELYTRGMQLARQYDIPVFAHCEDKSLAGSGVINAGRKAEELKLPGISKESEEVIVDRDIKLAEETGARLHLCHVSTSGSIKLLAGAKQEGLPVTAECCPHHFTLSEEDITEDDSDFKMNPPLRSPEDVRALKEALRDGIIEVIATDHAPHSAEEKAGSMLDAPFGIVGLETAFALSLTELVKTGYLTPYQMVERISTFPARLACIERGCISEGWMADIVIADPDEHYQIDRESFFSKGRNTPFHGRMVYGRILYTIVSGRIVYNYYSN